MPKLDLGMNEMRNLGLSCEQMPLLGALKGAEVTDGTMIENQRLGAHPAQQMMIVAGEDHDAGLIDYSPDPLFSLDQEIRVYRGDPLVHQQYFRLDRGRNGEAQPQQHA